MMKNKTVSILTGPVRSGKTTKLMQWSAGKKDVFGILSPVVNGQRVFMDASGKKQFQMEAEPGEEGVFQVGKYIFSKKAFEKANGILEKAIKEKNGWIVVDEIGPLELRGEGFHEMIKKIMSSEISLSILLVVRNKILDEVMQHYGMDSAKVMVIDANPDFFQQ